MKPYYEEPGIQIYHGDCREYKNSGNLVDMIITSPPYNCGKRYGTYLDNLSYNGYWEFIEKWLSVSFESLCQGGRMAVNIPWWIGKKPRKDYPFKFKEIAKKLDYLFLDKITWIKGNGINQHVSGGWGGGGCGWGTYMSPSGPAIRCASEPILIFSKDSRGRKRISGKGKGDCLKGDISKDEFLKWTIDTWFINGNVNKQHPATFPIELPTRLIKLYTYPNEIIIDPFMGSGTTLRAAKDLGRKAIGIEIEEKYCEIAVERLRQQVLDL